LQIDKPKAKAKDTKAIDVDPKHRQDLLGGHDDKTVVFDPSMTALMIQHQLNEERAE
jgi:hypothetical protein